MNLVHFNSSIAVLPRVILAVSTLMLYLCGNAAYAEEHSLRPRGRTLVEAEEYSRASPDTPLKQPSPWCSGQKLLGFFWLDAWFEITIEVPNMLNYSVSLRSSSMGGTQMEMNMVKDSGMTMLAKIEVPKTASWLNYVNTENVIVSLPAGVHTLRFINRGRGLNIDYITFTAGASSDVVTTAPDVNSGPSVNPLKGFCSSDNRTQDQFASVGFQELEWGRFEPKDDLFDWDYVERLLGQEGSKGRHFILQFVVDRDNPAVEEPVGNSHYLGPDWLLDRTGENRGRANPDDSRSRITRATQYDDPIFIEEATEAITRLLERYGNDPRAFIFQAGVLGFDGQWNTGRRNEWRPSPFTKSAILKAYLDNLGRQQNLWVNNY